MLSFCALPSIPPHDFTRYVEYLKLLVMLVKRVMGYLHGCVSGVLTRSLVGVRYIDVRNIHKMSRLATYHKRVLARAVIFMLIRAG